MELVKKLTVDFTIKNIVFKVNKETLNCNTISWHPGTFITTDDLQNEIDNYFSHFKISDATSNLKPTFKIQNKFSFSPMKMDNEKQKYFVSGQVWATMKEFDPVCEVLNIKIS